MSILTGPEIQKQVYAGNIKIDPFVVANINPNSYNLSIGTKILETCGLECYIDKKGNKRYKPVFKQLEITKLGLYLYPGKGYLAASVEVTNSGNYVPEIDGRSSLGRLFTLVHCTAGYGDIGFHGTWTYEIVPLVHEIIVYPGDMLCQIRFTTSIGDILPYDQTGRYQNQINPTESKGI